MGIKRHIKQKAQDKDNHANKNTIHNTKMMSNTDSSNKTGGGNHVLTNKQTKHNIEN